MMCLLAKILHHLDLPENMCAPGSTGREVQAPDLRLALNSNPTPDSLLSLPLDIRYHMAVSRLMQGLPEDGTKIITGLLW